MSTKTQTIVHILKDGLTLPAVMQKSTGRPHGDLMATSGVVHRRGDQIELSDALIEATRDRFGYSIFDDLTDDNLARHGLGPGPTPDWLAAELDDEAQVKAEVDRVERVREARRFGRRVVVIQNGEVTSNGVQHD